VSTLPSAWQRIKGLVWQELYLTRRRLEIIGDTVFFPMMNVILFGYITSYIGNGGNVEGTYFIMGILLWEVLVIMQYNVSVGSLWSIWSHNLTNVFIAPISIKEYLTAHILAAAIRTLAVVGLLAVGTYLAFGFNILDLGAANLGLFTLNLMLFACALGVVLLGTIFRFGLRVQALCWYTVFLFQPLTAVFFPVSVLPGFLQAIAYTLPPTYVFEAARAALENPSVDWRSSGIALGLNLLYLGIAFVVFSIFFRRSKESGQFARNDL
jgi:ABC-2 type transport system permease protein